MAARPPRPDTTAGSRWTLARYRDYTHQSAAISAHTPPSTPFLNSRIQQRLKRRLRRVAVEVDLQLVDDLRGQLRHIPSILRREHHSLRTRVHRDPQLVAQALYSAQHSWDAHLSEDDQPARHLPAQHRGNQPDVKCHSQIRGILPLHQAHDLDVEIVRRHVTVNADLLRVRLQVVVSHPGALPHTFPR